jgi:hypothetical protein
VTRPALSLAACLLLSACGPRATFVCAVDGVDVVDFQAPAKLGRVTVERVEVMGRTDSGKVLVLGCERGK